MDILNQFGVQPILLAAQVVNFLILLFILKKFLYKPLLKVLDVRRKKIEDSLKNAEEIELRLQATNEKIDKMILKAAEDIGKMNEEAKKEIILMKEEGKIQAQNLAAQIIKKSEESAKAEAEKMRQEMIAGMAGIIGIGMEKVAKGAFDKNKQKEIIEREIRNLS